LSFSEAHLAHPVILVRSLINILGPSARSSAELWGVLWLFFFLVKLLLSLELSLSIWIVCSLVWFGFVLFSYYFITVCLQILDWLCKSVPSSFRPGLWSVSLRLAESRLLTQSWSWSSWVFNLFLFVSSHPPQRGGEHQEPKATQKRKVLILGSNSPTEWVSTKNGASFVEVCTCGRVSSQSGAPGTCALIPRTWT
jgi:hypothetical protein